MCSWAVNTRPLCVFLCRRILGLKTLRSKYEQKKPAFWVEVCAMPRARCPILKTKCVKFCTLAHFGSRGYILSRSYLRRIHAVLCWHAEQDTCQHNRTSTKSTHIMEKPAHAHLFESVKTKCRALKEGVQCWPPINGRYGSATHCSAILLYAVVLFFILIRHHRFEHKR